MYKKCKGENAALFQGSKVPTLQSVQDAGGISALAIVCQIVLEAKRTGGSMQSFRSRSIVGMRATSRMRRLRHG